MPTQPGPDAAYYLLGCEHLAAGQWVWGGEPPLAFLVLYPFTRVLSGPKAFTVCSALFGGLAVYLMGELCARLAVRTWAGPQSRRQPAAVLGALIGAVLCLGYMYPWFMTGLLKNQVANVLVIGVLLALTTGNLLRSGLFLLLAASAHPGVALTLAVALVATAGLTLAGRVLAASRNGHGVCRAAGRLRDVAKGRGPLLLGLGLLVIAVAAVATPTVVRYLSSYLRSDSTAEGAAVFNWDAVALIARYLPLWIPAAMSLARAVSRRDGPGPTVRHATTSLVVCSVWAVVLAAMASVSGLTSRRFEVQMFAPLVALAGAEMAQWRGEMPALILRRRLARRAGLLVAPVFGLVVAAAALAGAEPLLHAPQVEALKSMDAALPQDARIVVYQSDARYWVEYYARRPVLSPFLARERLSSPGPVYLFSEREATYGMEWPPETLSGLARRGVTVWDADGLLLFKAQWNQAFFDDWQGPRENETVIALLEADMPEGFGGRGRLPPVAGTVLGWTLFLPLGLARAAGLGPELATAAGLPLTLVLWWFAAGMILRCSRRHTVTCRTDSRVASASGATISP